MAQTLDGIIDGLGSAPVILVERDESCRMARIFVAGLCVMEGNAWDFYPGCHGGWHYDLAARFGRYSSAEGMALALAQAVASSGRAGCRIERGAYVYRRAA